MDASDQPLPDVVPTPPPGSLFDALPDAVVRFDLAGRVVYVNPAFERATAIGRSSFVGHTLDKVEGFAPYAALWHDALRDVFETEQESWFKFRFDHPLGQRHFDVRLLLERDPPLPHVTALLRDVTYTRGAVRASRGADALAETVLSNVNFGVAVLDRELRYRHWNSFLERCLGITATQVLGRRLTEVFDFSAQPDVLASLERLRSGAAVATEQHEYEFPSGVRPWLRERRTPMFDARGVFEGVFITFEPIDVERFAATSLSALRRALEQAGEMVLEIGADGTVLDANDSALHTLGLTRTDFGTLSLLAIEPDLSAGQLRGLLDRLHRLGAERRETRYRTGSGSELQVDVIAQRAVHAQRESFFLLARDISERKRSEVALVESAERFRSLFDESPVALLLLDANLRVVQANRAAGQLLDRALIDLIGEEAASLLQPADADAAQRLRRDLVAEALRPAESDIRIVHPGGQIVWARLIVRAWRGAERQRQYLLVLEDYTDRKQAALQLETAVAQQRTLLETMTAAVAQVRGGIVLRANGEFARLFGFDEAALIGMDLARLTAAPDPDAGYAPSVLPTIEVGRTTSTETMVFRANGQPLWCQVQARALEPALADASSADEAIFTFQDVTTLRESRETLARSLLELNLVFDSTEVALLHLADGRVIRCNAQAAAMFGGVAGPIGRAFTALLDWSPDQPVPAWLDAGAAGAGAQQAEVRMRGVDSKPFWALVSMRAIDPLKANAGQIVTVLNIDARKRSEDEVVQMRNYLDLVVESLPVMVAVRDARDGRFIGINRAGEALIGRPRSAVIGRTWHQLFPRAFADELEALDKRAIEDGQMVDQPRVAGLGADDKPLTVHRRVLPVFEAVDGETNTHQPRYLMSIVDDLTGTVRTEAALRDTEAHFRELAEHIDAFVFIADRSLNTLTYVSPRSEALLGIPAPRLQADPRLALERVQAQERPQLARRLPLVLARLGRLRKSEITVRIDHPTRGARMITVRFTPVRMPDGDLRIFGIAEDTTEREAAQDQRVADALKQRDLLVHEVHHRIKNNLQGVAGLLQQQAFAKPELTESLSEAATQIQAVALVHGLQLSESRTLPLVALVQGIFASLGGMYNVIVQVEHAGPGVAGWRLPEGEAVPLALVINELGGNAIKHRGKSEQRVVARLNPRGAGVELRIEQSGRLKEDFDLARYTSGVSGLGLVKALLPRRGTRLRIEQLGPLVITRLELAPPSIRYEATIAAGSKSAT